MISLRRGTIALVEAPPRFAWLLAGASALAIFVLSSLPGSSLGPHDAWRRFLFNLVHAPLYFVLAFFVAAALARRGATGTRLDPRGGALALCVVMLYALADEWHQSFVGGRSPDGRDLVTDLGGALAAVALLGWWSGGLARPRALALLVCGVVLALGAAAAATAGLFRFGSPG